MATKKTKKGKRGNVWYDQPMLRHISVKADIVIGSEGKNFAQLRANALDHTQTMEPDLSPGKTPSMPASNNWVQMGPFAIPNGQTYGGARVLVSGRITSIAVDPANAGTIYIGAAQGGVWKTTDGGINWTPKSDNEASLAIGSIAIDPSNTQIIYAATGEGNFAGDSYYGAGVLRSNNGGDSWTLVGAATFLRQRFSRIIVHPATTTTLFAASSLGIYRSQNSGTAWSLIHSGGFPGTDVAIDTSNPDILYVAMAGGGIFKSTNANAAIPTFTQLTTGLPTTGIFRATLAIAPTDTQTIYLLMCQDAYPYNITMFYVSINGGSNWNSIPLPGGNLGGQGFYNLDMKVDPTTPDIVYLCVTEMRKATKIGSTWTITKIGANIHPDCHALAFNPTDHLTIYAGSDGGIYKSTNGGSTWDDTINKGISIAQLEFIDQHPTSDAVLFGGTQDNGTEQFRNSAVFNHAQEGDGGFCSIDQSNPDNVIHEFYSISPERSTQGGKFGTWTPVDSGITGTRALFYPPFTLNQVNQNEIAYGTENVCIDTAQGTAGWGTTIVLPGLTATGTNLEMVSAISFINSNLLYAGTNRGKIFRCAKTAGTWAATNISPAGIANRYVWDVQTMPANNNSLITVVSGFGTPHVWQCANANTAPVWTDISGIAPNRLPDIPVNALVIDTATTFYIGTDVGVYRTINGGTSWALFNNGMPNVAIFDLKLHQPTRLLRAATHGRGIWEFQLDVPAPNNVDLYVRDHVMSTARILPTPSGIPSAFEDPLQHVNLNDNVYWWQCGDIKVDALEGSPLSYQMNVSAVNYLTFESSLIHRNPQRTRINRAYIQIHNRGINDTNLVNVKVLYADASAGLPDLPSDFWTAFPADPTTASPWHVAGTATNVSVRNTVPTILEFDFNPPATQAQHTCMLVVMDSSDDPIPAANKVFDIGQLVTNEKRAGLKNLHLIDALPAPTGPGTNISVVSFNFFGTAASRIKVLGYKNKFIKVGFIFPVKFNTKNIPLKTVKRIKPSKTHIAAIKKFIELNSRQELDIRNYDLKQLFTVSNFAEITIADKISITKKGLPVLLVIEGLNKSIHGTSFSIVQENKKGQITGGSTFVINKLKKPR